MGDFDYEDVKVDADAWEAKTPNNKKNEDILNAFGSHIGILAETWNRCSISFYLSSLLSANLLTQNNIYSQPQIMINNESNGR